MAQNTLQAAPFSQPNLDLSFDIDRLEAVIGRECIEVEPTSAGKIYTFWYADTKFVAFVNDGVTVVGCSANLTIEERTEFVSNFLDEYFAIESPTEHDINDEGCAVLHPRNPAFLSL